MIIKKLSPKAIALILLSGVILATPFFLNLRDSSPQVPAITTKAPLPSATSPTPPSLPSQESTQKQNPEKKTEPEFPLFTFNPVRRITENTPPSDFAFTPIHPQAPEQDPDPTSLAILPKIPSIVDLEITSPQHPEPRFIRGAVLTQDGKVLTLASFFPREDLKVRDPASHEILSIGFLSRDEKSPFIILKMNYPSTNRSQLVDRWLLEITPKTPLLLPTPTEENPQLAKQVFPIPPPGKTDVSDAGSGSFWIKTDEEFIPGTPLFTPKGYLAGIAEKQERDPTLWKIHKVAAPLPLLEEAATQTHLFGWNEKFTRKETKKPFPEAKLDPTLIENIETKLTGDPLVKASDQLLHKDEKNPAAWYYATKGYARAGKSKQALASAEMLTTLAPNRWESWLLFAQQLEVDGKIPSALDAYQKAGENDAPPELIKIPMALALLKSGGTDAGLDQLQQQALRATGNQEIWIALANAQLAAKKSQEAAKSFAKVIEGNPLSIPTWKSLAAIYDQLKFWPGSTEAYAQLTLLEPQDEQHWIDLGNAFLKLKRPENARVAFKNALVFNPSNPVATEQLAKLEAALKK